MPSLRSANLRRKGATAKWAREGEQTEINAVVAVLIRPGQREKLQVA